MINDLKKYLVVIECNTYKQKMIILYFHWIVSSLLLE
jgi:hypothetical protein